MSGKAEQLAEFTDFAGTLADAAARVTLPLFRSEIAVADKGGARDFDPVTQADKGAEQAIGALIAKTYPDHGVLGEEGTALTGASLYRWVIDPIDGTRAFIAGIPLWTTLIALNDGTKPILGLVDQPYLGERFTGSAAGAFLHARGLTQRLASRTGVRLKDAIFSTTTPALFASPREKSIHAAIAEQARLARYGCDAYAYALLAAGRIDLVVEVGLQPWDVQALIPLIEAAGGAITNFEGNPAMDGGSVVAAGSADLLTECLELIKNT